MSLTTAVDRAFLKRRTHSSLTDSAPGRSGAAASPSATEGRYR